MSLRVIVTFMGGDKDGMVLDSDVPDGGDARFYGELKVGQSVLGMSEAAIDRLRDSEPRGRAVGHCYTCTAREEGNGIRRLTLTYYGAAKPA